MITFIIPAYQAERTITRTIESILGQTDGRWRMILINDGSTDETGIICKSYQDAHPDKVSYICQKNGGLGKARNQGIELVETKYMAFLDSDDWLMPEYVERILPHVEKNPVEMVMCLPVIYHEKSLIVRDWYDKTVFRQIFSEDGRIIRVGEVSRVYQLEVNACRKILKTDFVKRIGFRFPEGIKWEDVFPHFYLLSRCESCMGISSVGFYYRIGSSGQITALRGRDRLDILTIFDELLDYVMAEKNRDMEFPAMRIFVRFSIWCIKMTEGEVRRALLQGLHVFFRKIPISFYRALRKGTANNYTKADARQYRLFLLAIRHKPFCRIFEDYLYEEGAEKLIKKLLRAKDRVA